MEPDRRSLQIFFHIYTFQITHYDISFAINIIRSFIRNNHDV